MMLLLINAGTWLVVQLSIAAIATHLPSAFFAGEGRLDRTYNSEVAFYRDSLRIRRWKHLLPDGARWVGGSFRKKRLLGRDAAYLRQLIVETRRGEAAHWAMLACFPIFFLWNPGWAVGINAFYAVAANLPCILTQRYNRHIAKRLVASFSHPR